MEKILARREELRVVIIAGPSSSGKTTTTIKMREKLSAAGIATVPLAVDNYFFDLTAHPKIGKDDYDYETPQAIDLQLINEHLQELMDGGTVTVPRYDFTTGRREGDAGPADPPRGPGAVDRLAARPVPRHDTLPARGDEVPPLHRDPLPGQGVRRPLHPVG